MDLVSARLGYGIQLSRLIFRTLWSQRQFLISWACWPASYWSYPRRLAPLNMTCFHLQAFMQTKVIYDFSLFLLFKKADFYPNWEFWPQVCGLNHWDNILPNMFLRTILKFFQHISRFLGSLLKKLENMIRSSLHVRLKPTKWELHPQQSTAVTVTLQGKAAPTMSSEVNMKGCLSTPLFPSKQFDMPRHWPVGRVMRQALYTKRLQATIEGVDVNAVHCCFVFLFCIKLHNMQVLIA